LLGCLVLEVYKLNLECLSLGRRVKPPVVPSPNTCWPNQAVLSNTCARLTLLLDKVKLPQNTTVEGLCGNLRQLLAQQQAISGLQDDLVLLCDLKTDYNDTIEVTLVRPINQPPNSPILYYNF